MKLKHWNFIALIACVVGTSALQKKHPPRCPVCREPLVFVGRRFGGGLWGVSALDQIHCTRCGAVISSKDLPE